MLGIGAEEDEDTVVRPETLVRRALEAIDPDYARRTSYSDSWEGRPARSELGSDDEERSRELESDFDEDDDEQDPDDRTQRRPSRMVGAPGALPALRVAVVPIPEDGDVRLLFLPPGVEPPVGVAVALLVPPTPADAELITSLYERFAVKP